ncbi:MAG: AsmA family protein [Rubrivivax sp.]|nr:MAG: AsmA family protein [Rubrivivax sp.]
MTPAPDQTSETSPQPVHRRSFVRRHPVLLAAGSVVVVAAALFAAGEMAGWPFLAGPVSGLLSKSLNRQVVFVDSAQGGDSTFRVHLLGGIRASSALVQVGAPSWSREPYTFRATDAELDVAYHDLWRVWRGRPLNIEGLVASQADARLERLSDGRSSWQFGHPERKNDRKRPLVSSVSFERLQLAQGTISYVDATLQADVKARFSLNEGVAVDSGGVVSTVPIERGRDSAAAARSAAADRAAPGLVASATGRFRGNALKGQLAAARPSAWFYPSDTERSPVHATLDVGRVSANYHGEAGRTANSFTLRGEYQVKGPSLGAAGEPLGVTLPTTDPFEVRGRVVKGPQEVWSTVVSKGRVGSSDLTGALVFDRRPAVPLLKGRVNSSRLMLADLAPTVGGTTEVTGRTTPQGKVIPVREFDLPSLKAMNANVLINFAMLDLNTSVLEPIEPLSAHLVLNQGVLAIKDIEARTASGEVNGHLTLEARSRAAQFNTDLAWKNVRLERFVKVQRAPGQPPFISGSLEGRARLKGNGRSSAQILSALNGTIETRLRDGTVSHLLVEGAGLDLAQALAVLFKGDDSLKVPCALADFNVDKGVMVPNMLVIDSQDSGVWMSGQISLAAETLNLKAVVAPKDFSIATVRSPIHVNGTFANPDVSLEKAPIATKVIAAAVLAAVNPLAALIPLIDPGNRESAEKAAQACRTERLETVKG